MQNWALVFPSPCLSIPCFDAHLLEAVLFPRSNRHVLGVNDAANIVRGKRRRAFNLKLVQ